MKFCACGCGQPVNKDKKYIQGHYLKKVAKQRRVEELLTEIGVHGTPIFGGIIWEDYNEKFRDLQSALAIYDEMRRSDGTVSALLLTLELPILSTKFIIKPGRGPFAEEIAEFIEWNLFEGMSHTFKDFLRQALSLTWAGFSVFEKCFEWYKGKIKWKKFAVRLPRTILRWEFDEAGGPRGVWQLKQAPDGTPVEVFIGIERLLIFTNRREGSNLQGLSFLRPAYKHWYYKDKLYRLWAISLERSSVGVPVISLPLRSSKKDKQIAEDIVKSLRLDEGAGVTIPATWTLDLLEAKRGPDFFQAIDHHDLMIVKSVLAQFLNLPQGKYGSYALSADQSSLLLQALNYLADYLCEVINRYAIQQLVDLNWPGVTHYPKLVHHPISPRNVREVAYAWATLAKVGLLSPSTHTERYIRDFLGLPEKEEKARSSVQLEGAPELPEDLSSSEDYESE